MSRTPPPACRELGDLARAVKGKEGTYPVSVANLPLAATVVLDPPTAETGQCLEAAFPGLPDTPTCTAGKYASVSGGFVNLAFGDYSSVAGGTVNRATAPKSSVAGGRGNFATGDQSAVGGGERNTASGPGSSVSGGSFNEASGERSSVSGGVLAQATARESAVSGGSNRTVLGPFDWRAGSSFEDF